MKLISVAFQEVAIANEQTRKASCISFAGINIKSEQRVLGVIKLSCDFFYLHRDVATALSQSMPDTEGKHRNVWSSTSPTHRNKHKHIHKCTKLIRTKIISFMYSLLEFRPCVDQAMTNGKYHASV